jgi:hypothetical protein
MKKHQLRKPFLAAMIAATMMPAGVYAATHTSQVASASTTNSAPGSTQNQSRPNAKADNNQNNGQQKTQNATELKGSLSICVVDNGENLRRADASATLPGCKKNSSLRLWG